MQTLSQKMRQASKRIKNLCSFNSPLNVVEEMSVSSKV